ncbi:MAG: hypothetical protein ACLFR1_08785 [Spirochaetia bacterium]
MRKITTLQAVLLLFFVCTIGYSQDIDMSLAQATDEFRWGVRAFHNGFLHDAVLSFERALTYQPDNMLAKEWLGRVYYRSGFEESALNTWETISESGQASALLQNTMDIIRLRRGVGRELYEPGRFVIAAEIEGFRNDVQVFSRPAGITAGPYGEFYISSFATHEIHRLNVNGAIVSTLRGGVEGFDHPFDVLPLENGNFIVSEYEGCRLAIVNSLGNKLRTIGTRGRGEGQFLGPQYLSQDEEGYLYVSDWGNRRISKFNLEGDFILSIGSATNGYPGLRGPSGIAVIGDRLFIADAVRRHIAVFDLSGNYINTIVEDALNAPEGIVALDETNLLVADTNRLVRVGIEEETVEPVSTFEGSAERVLDADMDANGNVIATDFNAERVTILSDITSLYSGFFVQINRVIAQDFPQVDVVINVEDRLGNPITGLQTGNFLMTESSVPVNDPELIFTGYDAQIERIAFLVDRSAQMSGNRSDIRRAVIEVLQNVSAQGSSIVVTAGENPVLDASETDSVTDIVNAAVNSGEYTDDWQFDLGLRLAGSELIPGRTNRAVVFITNGQLPRTAFSNYGLIELAAFLRNNGIAFYTVYVDEGAHAQELE